jgi:glycosyltransferase involved in cell wall biosynthesis
MSGVIYADLRCLQDPAYRGHGMGCHLSALLRTQKHSPLADWKTVGLVDPSMEELTAEYTAMVDETSPSWNPCWNDERSIFIDGSPMTFDTRFSLRIQNRARLIAAAILYDFIPPERPTVARRIEYMAKLARLKKFDLFFPISEYIAGQLAELVGVSTERIRVTGACVQPSLYEERFWTVVSEAVEKRPGTANLSHRSKPRIAFISPYPPDPSDAASYVAGSVKAGKELFDSDVYTDAVCRPASDGCSSEIRAISLAPFADRRYNAIVSVLGNSSWHKRAFELFERYGGPCILHDVRLTHIYFARLGPQGFLKFAERFLHRPVSLEEAQSWLRGDNAPSLFIERIIDRATPLMVQSQTQRALIQKRYGVNAHVLTTCPTVHFEEPQFAAAEKQKMRAKYGVHPNTFLIASFAPFGKADEIATAILALELLRSWNVGAELYFAGDLGARKNEATRISALYDVAGYVHFGDELAEDAVYRDLHIACDAAVQLQPYGFGQAPTNLMNCISAGLAAVANEDAAESCDAPAYVSTVPDVFSPLQVAEKLALIWEAKAEYASRRDARRHYLESHNFENYAKRLWDVLRTA